METWMEWLWTAFFYSFTLITSGYLIFHFVVLALAYLFFRLRWKLSVFRAFLHALAVLAVFTLLPLVFWLYLGWWLMTGIQLPIYVYANPQYYSTFLLVVSGLIVLLTHRLYRKRSRIEAIFSSLFWGVIVLLFGSFAFFLDDRCGNVFSDAFHPLNQHIKDLCTSRSDTGECPRTVSELRAFMPEQFDDLMICTHDTLQYTVNPEERTYHFSVQFRNQTLYATQDVEWASIQH